MKNCRSFSLSVVRRPLLIAVLTVSLSACSISTPLGPIFGSPAHDTPTGSIAPHDARFSPEMTDEDWQQANAALQIAFDAKAAGRAALWNNSQSGLQGSIAPVAEAYPEGEGHCRAFVASLGAAPQRWYQGRACRTGEAPWNIVASAPWTVPPPQ